MKTYKYRIYPTKAQETLLNQQLEVCRWVYNKTLGVRKDAWVERQESLSYYDTKKMLPEWKKVEPKFKLVHSQVLQDVVLRVDLAYRAFFRRVKTGAPEGGNPQGAPGYPRFKGKGRYDSMCYPQYGNGATLDGGCPHGAKLNLSKIGAIKVELHRELCGQPKTVCIRRNAQNKWFATLSCEYEPHFLPRSEKIAGVDVGTATFATLSNGEKIANPRFFRKEQKALAQAQRRLEKEAKGTPERAKRRKVVARVHERIANKRTNFAHQQSRRLVNAYGVLVFEKLDITGLLDKHTIVFGHKLNKSIADVAWHQFVQFAAYKAEDAGRLCVQVDPRNTSQRCSRCQTLVPKELGDRVHDCPHCGLVLDRDHNAAINILALGLQRIGNQSVEAHAL